MLIHQFDEPFVVGRFQQMHQFMDNDVFQTLPWLFGKVGVQKYGLGGGVAATPFGLHAAHRDTVELPSCVTSDKIKFVIKRRADTLANLPLGQGGS